MSQLLAMVLAGGEGSRLKPLTGDRAKPAVPFGGKYRIIDFVLSNFVNSGYYNIKVLTQYKSNSLNNHMSRNWHLTQMLGHYVESVPAMQNVGPQWFLGSADAVYQNLNLIEDEAPEVVAVFGGDHIYQMNIRQMVRIHHSKNAALTIAAIPIPLEEARDFGVIEIDNEWRMIGFEEKPSDPKPIPGSPEMALASMGNYLFKPDVLYDSVASDAQLEESSHDFGKNIIPALYPDGKVYVYDFLRNAVPGISAHEQGYWRDVGTIDAYWEASMDLVSVSPSLSLYNRRWPIHAAQTNTPPAKFVFADQEKHRIGISTDSMVCEGSIISGGHINLTIVGPNCRINSFSNVEESVLFENIDIGRHCRIRRTIVDKGVKVPAGETIGYDLEYDSKRFAVSDNGVVVIPKGYIFEED